MIHLRLRTEYNFRRAFGRIAKVLSVAEGEAVGVADPGSWGHAVFYKACKSAGRKPILGCEVFLVPNAQLRERQGGVRAALIARNNAGLEELYGIITEANREPRFYYEPRLDYDDINRASKSGNLYVLSGSGAQFERLTNRPNVYLELNPSNPAWNRRAIQQKGWSKVVCCNNYYPTVQDRVAWEIISGLGPGGKKGSARTSPQHILSEDELRIAVPDATDEEFLNTERIADD